jgi:hypothetical protein
MPQKPIKKVNLSQRVISAEVCKSLIVEFDGSANTGVATPAIHLRRECPPAPKKKDVAAVVELNDDICRKIEF